MLGPFEFQKWRQSAFPPLLAFALTYGLLLSAALVFFRLPHAALKWLGSPAADGRFDLWLWLGLAILFALLEFLLVPDRVTVDSEKIVLEGRKTRTIFWSQIKRIEWSLGRIALIGRSERTWLGFPPRPFWERLRDEARDVHGMVFEKERLLTKRLKRPGALQTEIVTQLDLN